MLEKVDAAKVVWVVDIYLCILKQQIQNSGIILKTSINGMK